MLQRVGVFLGCFGLLVGSAGVGAASVTCPTLAETVQVGACPSDEELRYTFSGYCSDDAKAYRGETDVCTDFARYRAMKNVSLWESSDGRFDGYASCSASPRERRQATAQTLELQRQGSLTKLVCTYSNNQTLTWRTRSSCRIDVRACGSTGTECSAHCD